MARMMWLVGLLGLGAFSHAISSRQGKTEQRSLNEDELYAVYAPLVPRDRFHAALYRPWDIKRALPFFNPQHAMAPPQPRLLDGPPHDRETLG